jgi:hypothetical protein
LQRRIERTGVHGVEDSVERLVPLTPRIAAIVALAVSGCVGSKTLEFGEEAFDEVAFAAELS